MRSTRPVKTWLAAAAVALAMPPTAASPGDASRLLGRLCHAEPAIQGPHRLVRLDGMGDDRMAVDTRSVAAQAWFDYGLTLARSFEHGDAVLAFQAAEAADPSCSLCVFGEAYARGPTINFGVGAKETAAALALAGKAERLAGPGLSPLQRRLEAALVERYRLGDLAWARDLDSLTTESPGDVELAIFDAEAWLIMQNDGEPSGPTRALAALKGLLPGHKDVSGLDHFFIHASENAGVPELALPYAALTAKLAPMASHMVHMPSHIWFRLGRYDDAVKANVQALEVDRIYAQKTGFAGPLGELTYHFHDIAFGLGAALLTGDRATALSLVAAFNADFPSPGGYDPRAEIAAGKALAAFGRFARPADVLALADQVQARPFLEAMRHYARGQAYVRLGRPADVRAEAALVRMNAGDPPPALPPGNAVVAEIARLTLLGDADFMADKPSQAARSFEAAARLQEARFNDDFDPPRWWYPARRSLAAALLAEGDARGAAREARATLAHWPLDPITLAILAEADRRLGRGDAGALEAEARKGWKGNPQDLRWSALS